MKVLIIARLVDDDGKLVGEYHSEQEFDGDDLGFDPNGEYAISIRAGVEK